MMSRGTIAGLVSIVMPAYNSAEFIEDSIKSVQLQTYVNWELLVVDDRSNDGTAFLVEELAKHDSRIRLIVNERNSGAALSRNKALHEARGEWIAFLDSDDLWVPEKLLQQIEFMSEFGFAFSYTEYQTIDEAGVPMGTVYSGPKVISQGGMKLFCWPGCLTVMYHQPTVGLIQIENLKRHNDYAMWLKASKRADCCLLPQTTAFYRLRKSSVSHGISIALQVKSLYALWRTGEHKGWLAAGLMTMVNVVFGAYKKIRYVSAVQR